MDEENKEKIRKLANLTKEEIGKSEEDVKINFIVPLFEAFGHERLKFEHRWKDALVENLDHSCKLVIETKNYEKDLDKELPQLDKYCYEERPLLGIIANGREIKIFSFFWRSRPTFRKTIIYDINRKDLKNESVMITIENILSISNLKSGKANDFIIEREREIENAENMIKKIESKSNEKVEQLHDKIGDLHQEVDDIKKQIEEYKSEKEKITKEIREQISQIWQNLGFPRPSIDSDPLINPPTPPGKNKSYIDKYRKMLENPNTIPSKMKRYIDEEGMVRYKDLKHIFVEEFGYKTETSGSIGASVRVLEVDGHIKIDGSGDNKRLISTKKE